MGFAISALSMFNGSFFAVDAKGYFCYGPYAAWVEYIDVANFVLILGIAVYHRQRMSTKSFLMFFAYGMLHLGGMLMVDIWCQI